MSQKRMNTRTIIFYWLLLLIPALLVGGILFKLLRQEERVLERASLIAAEEQAGAVAGHIRLALDEVKKGLLPALAHIPENALVPTLEDWERTNPLIRNVFIWNVRTGQAILPDTRQPMTQEQTAFLRHFQALFDAKEWPVSPDDTRPASEQRAAAYLPAPAARRELQRWTEPQPTPAATDKETLPASLQSGWVPWFWDNQLSLLGWVQRPGAPQRYGVEIEMTALVSRLINAFPSQAPEGLVLALVDGKGTIVHQCGGEIVSNNSPGMAAIPLDPVMPYWHVAVFKTASGHGAATQKMYSLLVLLITGIFMAAVITGGSLLLWQARRNMLDARQKTSFVSNVSHELKTPLTTIRMYAEMLGENRVTDASKRTRYLDIIIRESQRLTRLVNNVLDFSRLEQGRKQYHPCALDLADTLREILESQAVRLQEAGIRPNLVLPDSPCPATLDRDSLDQVLLNVIDNAIKYAASGQQLKVELLAGNRPYRIRVEDAGPGVPAAHRLRIFERFQRGDDRLTAAQPGTGLGLTISQRLLRDQGGDLLYEPASSGGACFVIIVP